MARTSQGSRAAVRAASSLRLHQLTPHPRISAQPTPPFNGGALVGGGSVSSTLLAGGVLVGGGLLTGSVRVVLP